GILVYRICCPHIRPASTWGSGSLFACCLFLRAFAFLRLLFATASLTRWTTTPLVRLTLFNRNLPRSRRIRRHSYHRGFTLHDCFDPGDDILRRQCSCICRYF